jgi:hypothetical protein
MHLSRMECDHTLAEVSILASADMSFGMGFAKGSIRGFSAIAKRLSANQSIDDSSSLEASRPIVSWNFS